jgi:hypothetical protein
VKLGFATAIVAAIVWAILILFAAATPFGPMHGGGPGWMHGGNMMQNGYMMHGGYPRMYGHGWVGLVAGLVLWPLVAGLAAWGTATIYNRLLGGAVTGEADTKSTD